MYEEGTDVIQDDTEATRYYKLAAAQGYSDGQHMLGYKYFLGYGVIQNPVKAHMLFNLSAAQGHKFSMHARKSAADKMNRNQISQAQALERECQVKLTKNCF